MDMIPYQDWSDKILQAVPGVQNGVPNPAMLSMTHFPEITPTGG